MEGFEGRDDVTIEELQELRLSKENERDGLNDEITRLDNRIFKLRQSSSKRRES